MIRTRTKIEAVLAAAFLLAISISSVFAVTRTISDVGDTVDTYIRNSKGNYWAATGANLRLAIFDLNSTSGGTVWLPSGTITITTEIGMQDNVALVGQGEGKTTIFSNEGAAFVPIWIYHDDHVTLSDLTIDMNDNGGNCIYVGDSDYTTIDHVELLNAGFQGIYVASSGTEHSIFTNIRVKHGLGEAGHGISVNNADNSVVANIIVENYDTDADPSEDGLDITDCYNSTFDNIIVQGCGWYDGIKLSASGPGLENCTFSNIVICNAQGYGIKMQLLKHCSFNNIVIKETGNYGINIYSGANRVHHCNFNNINMYNCNGGLGSGGDNLSFSNINIMNTAVRGLDIGGADLIFNNIQLTETGSYNKIGAVRNVIISNSLISYGSNVGLFIRGASNFIISNCIFVGNAGDAIDTTDVACNNYTISNCYFKGNAKAIDLHASDNYFMILGCIADSGDVIDINNALSYTRRVNDTIGTIT